VIARRRLKLEVACVSSIAIVISDERSARGSGHTHAVARSSPHDHALESLKPAFGNTPAAGEVAAMTGFVYVETNA